MIIINIQSILQFYKKMFPSLLYVIATYISIGIIIDSISSGHYLWYNLTIQAKECSYDLLNNISYPCSRQYECHTCWGKDSTYRCCTFCVENCHSNHVHKVPYKDTSKPFTCHCGKSKHKLSCCTRTYLLHGKDNVKQPFYECKDCFNNPSEEVCCFPCANKCHAKHNLTPCSQPPFESYCHCGLHCCKSLCH